MIDIKKAVDRFLCWKLPEHFNPDCGISFTRDYNQNTPYPAKHEPVGTNLFTAEQAREMFEHCLQDTLERLKAAEAGLPEEPECPPDGWPINPLLRAWQIYAYTLRAYAAQMKAEYQQIVDYVLGYFPVGMCYVNPIQAMNVVVDRMTRAEAELARREILSRATMDELGEMRDRANKAEAEATEANDKALRVLRGQFTQICSYCGWEANREGAQWADLQSHIKQCDKHPLVKAEAENKRLESEWSKAAQLNDDQAARIGKLEAENKALREDAQKS
jgi:hypothetical protein